MALPLPILQILEQCWAHGVPLGRDTELWDRNSPMTLARGGTPRPRLEASSPEDFRALNQSGWMCRLGYRWLVSLAFCWSEAGGAMLGATWPGFWSVERLWRADQRKMGNLTLPAFGGGVPRAGISFATVAAWFSTRALRLREKTRPGRPRPGSQRGLKPGLNAEPNCECMGLGPRFAREEPVREDLSFSHSEIQAST